MPRPLLRPESCASTDPARKRCGPLTVRCRQDSHRAAPPSWRASPAFDRPSGVIGTTIVPPKWHLIVNRCGPAGGWVVHQDQLARPRAWSKKGSARRSRRLPALRRNLDLSMAQIAGSAGDPVVRRYLTHHRLEPFPNVSPKRCVVRISGEVNGGKYRFDLVILWWSQRDSNP